MSQYGITATNLPDSHEAAVARNIYEAGTELLDLQFPSISNYYYDIATEYAGGGLLSLTRVWIQAMPSLAAQVHILNDGSAPSGTIGNGFDLVPTQYATLAPYTAIGIKRATVGLVIEDGQVIWRVSGYQTEAYITNSQTGFYDNSRDNAELTILQSTVPVAFDDDIPWILLTYHDTPLLNYSPPQSFLNGLEKESPYYLTYYIDKKEGNIASGARRIYFKEDPVKIHIRTFYLAGSNLNGWLVSWEKPTQDFAAWNFNLSNANGTSPDWSMTGGSGGWYGKMWQYDSSLDPRSGYWLQVPYWLFIFESTVPIVFNGVEILPSAQPLPTGDGFKFFFTKDTFTLPFGVYINNDTAALFEPTKIGESKYYYTGKFLPKLRFTSPVDNEDYEVEMYKLTELNYREITADMVTLDPTYIGKFGVADKWFAKEDTNAYINAYRAVVGEIPIADLQSITYSEMSDARSYSEVSLATIVDYFARFNPGFTSLDVYTTLYMDFYSAEVGPSPGPVDTLSVDFSSLFGSDVDVHDGGKGSEGHSWDPDGDDDKNKPSNLGDESKSIDVEIPENNPYNKFNRTYILNTALVLELSDLLSTTDETTMLKLLKGLEMFGAKPMDAIIDLRLYPFNVVQATNSAGITSKIGLGHYMSDIDGVLFSENPICAFSLGNIYIKPHYNSFLDYEPYTTIRLYVPYVGTIDLQPSIFMDHVVGVTMVVDYTTGACRAIVFKDKIPICYSDGIIGVSMLVTGDDATAYANGVIGNLVGAVGAGIGGLVDIATGNIGGAIKEGANAIGDLFDMGLSANDVKFQLAGATSPSVGNWMFRKCHIIIARPELALEEGTDLGVYGMDVGFATAYTKAINELTPGGIYYGVLPGHIGIYGNEPAATAKERDMIKDALNNGFYVGAGYPD